MQAYPGRRTSPVIDALSGRMSVRLLRVMVEHLPPENAVSRALVSSWGDTLRLLHDAASSLRMLTASYYNVHRGDGTPPLAYEPIPTPETSAPARTARDPERAAAEQSHLLEVLHRADQA